MRKLLSGSLHSCDRLKPKARLALMALCALGVLATSSVSAQTSPAPSLSAPHLNNSVPLPSSLPRLDPEIVKDALNPVSATSEDQAPSVMDHTQIALAELNDTADAAATQRKITLYKQLMELNGTSTNLRLILNNAKDVIRNVVIERAGVVSLSPEQQVRYDEIATRILKETEVTLINDIAQAQAKGFTEDEIKSLITANASPAASKYNAGKFAAPAETSERIQSYMVEAVVKILKAFKGTVTS